jgi:hypothetical protein
LLLLSIDQQPLVVVRTYTPSQKKKEFANSSSQSSTSVRIHIVMFGI